MFSLSCDFLNASSMGENYIIEEIREDGLVQVARLEGDYVVVGREPDRGGIALESAAISRRHGVLARYGSHWLYRDLESTNGSWVNGTRLPANRWRLVRPGDLLQLADLALQITALDAAGQKKSSSLLARMGSRSLLVFANEAFAGEFPVPEYGRALVIGGANPDLELEGDLFEQASLIAERRGDDVVVYNVAKEFPIILNGSQIGGVEKLKDGDEVMIQNYIIIYNDPSGSQVPSSADTALETATVVRGWDDADGEADASASLRGARKPIFGQRPPEDESDETFAMEVGQVGSLRGMRGGGLHDEAKKEYSLTSLEDKVMLTIGFTLLLALAVLALLWALSG